MFKVTLPTRVFRGAIALTAIFGASIAVMGAQTVSTVKPATASFEAPVIDTSSDLLFSSSTTENAEPVTEASLAPATPNFAELMQYGGRPRGARGGRPRYRGANTNPDGSNKWTGYGGFGLTQPVGNTFHYFTPSWGLQVGFGRQFSKKFALPIEFDYDHFGLTGQTLGNQETLYNNDTNYYCNLNSANQSACINAGVTETSSGTFLAVQSLDGNMHTWSFSVDPTYTFFQSESVGAYAVAGVGFYHKVTNFTTPETGEEEDYYGDIYEYTANEVIDHYTSNAPGFSAGFGLTYKFSRFSNERFYGEVRYVFVDNSYRPGVTVASNVATTYTELNDFPANSNRTTYFPIKFGIRF
jgi:hypothetical protein